MRSFADPDTNYRLEREEVPVGDGGLTAVRPTGVVICAECGGRHTNVDDIPHDQDCPQRGVHSHWYADQFVRDR